MNNSTEENTSSSTGKRKREDDLNSGSKTLRDIESLFKDVKPVLPCNRQSDYLNTFRRSLYDSSMELTWSNLERAVDNFLSYYMIRKVCENAEGLRSAAKAIYNLVHYCNNTCKDFIIQKKNSLGKVDDGNNLLAHTQKLANYPYEVVFELQKLWETFYWEKKEEVYPHLRASKFELEPGDTFTKTVDEKEVEVVVKESDMIMTKGDINNNCGGAVGIYLAMARVMGILFRDMGYGGSTSDFLVRGKYRRIFIGRNPKEHAAECLEDFRSRDRRYEKKLVDEVGGRITIEKVCKNGWWMKPETNFRSNETVFVPLTAKVAKMGVEGSVFSGMRLGFAGGVWRPLPSEEEPSTICYNVYPPGLYVC